MMRRFRNAVGFVIAVLAVNVVFSVSSAWALKTWANGEVVQTADLNANFSTVNTAATALVTDAKVSASAAINRSKLDRPALVPKAWFAITTTCSSTPCTVADSSRTVSVTRASAGVYTANWTDSLSFKAVLLTALLPGATDQVFCQVNSTAATSTIIHCFNDAGTPTDVAFSGLVMSSTNT